MTVMEFHTHLVAEGNSLKKFAVSLTRDMDEALDLLQDTYLKAITYRGKFVQSSNLKAWLFTIMKNTFINSYRHRARTRKLISQGDEHTLNRAFVQNSYNHSESRLQAKEIVKHIEKLDAEYRIPFTRFYTGYRYEEIAREMRLPLGTVKSRIFVARKLLMTAIDPKNN